jgi:hypothetical protein
LKKIIVLSILGCAVFASDPITLDSLFKNQEGLRSITTLQSISSGSSDSFASYPDLVAVNEGRAWQDVKSLSLTQTFLYGLTPKLDILASVTGSAKRREYVDAGGYGHSNSNDLDSLWVGGMYSFDSDGAFKPQITAQAALFQKERFLDKTADFSLKSFYIKGALKNYSDPVVSTLYLGSIVNSENKIGEYNVNNGNVYFAGIDMSIILTPNVSLDLGMEQRYQTQSQVNGVQASNSATISTMSMGATYALSAKSSLSVSGSSGGSSRSPDSVFSVSLWQKF